MKEAQKPFRVLCIDGGGMRGLYTAALLDNLIKRVRDGQTADAGKAFDLIVGTSTGGILAAGLAHGVPLQNIIQLYRKEGPKIFTNPTPTSKGPGLLEKVPTLASWIKWCKRRSGAAHSGQAALRRALDQQFGNTTVEELYQNRGIALCIPAVLMATRKAWVFKTPHIPARAGHQAKTRDNKYRLTDVCLATSAAPIILPLVAIDNPDDSGAHDVFADGGLWANNPTLIGLIEALEITESNRDIQIISVSTASPPAGKVIKKNKINLPLVGDKSWKFGVEALETSLDAQSSGTEFMAKFIAPHLKAKVRVIRLAYNAPSNEQALCIGIDKADADCLAALTDMARSDAQNSILGINGKNTADDVALLREIIQTMPAFENSQRKAA